MKKVYISIVSLIFTTNLFAAYPSHWWAKIPDSQRQGSWEILPHEAKQGQLVLSKRNELGVFSNLAPTAFVFDGVKYASVEALWQMMKYPDPMLENDPRMRYQKEFPYTRQAILGLSGFESKRAGSAANKINKKHGVFWISYQNKVFNYKDFADGSQYHYQLIYRAIFEKLRQNPKLIELLNSTKGLELIPDHKMREPVPPSYRYHKILQDVRDRALK